MPSANATTGVLGNPLYIGFDLNNLTPMQAGDQIDYWDREVSFDFAGKLYDPIACNTSTRRAEKYNLLANILLDRENIHPNTDVEFYASGAVKEIRVKRTRYRIVNSKYLGKFSNTVRSVSDDTE